MTNSVLVVTYLNSGIIIRTMSDLAPVVIADDEQARILGVHGH